MNPCGDWDENRKQSHALCSLGNQLQIISTLCVVYDSYTVEDPPSLVSRVPFCVSHGRNEDTYPSAWVEAVPL